MKASSRPLPAGRRHSQRGALMSESPRPTTRLVLEPLEAREVPAFGLDTTFAAGGFALDPAGTVRFSSIAGAAAGPNDTLVAAGTLVGPGAYGANGDVAVARLTATGV